MRVIGCVVVLIMYLNPKLSYAQKPESLNKIFVRVYNLNDKKIGTGKIAFINDSVIGLRRSEVYRSLFLKDIGRIKTKKSAGNNIAKGALVGTGVGVALAITANEDDLWPYSRGGAILAFGFSGAFYGAAVGGITAIFKNSEGFIINGDSKRWQLFKESVAR
ncbi:hypothetical protein [Cognatitamlana onchidii]|uniref:hypothetical protein n=1 Tax=Cognatitamlana onchidii TaxID=2562860 RepID=UPI0010A66D5F|nr:hypothetical protein [Algibacter onchidii]